MCPGLKSQGLTPVLSLSYNRKNTKPRARRPTHVTLRNHLCPLRVSTFLTYKVEILTQTGKNYVKMLFEYVQM